MATNNNMQDENLQKVQTEKEINVVMTSVKVVGVENYSKVDKTTGEVAKKSYKLSALSYDSVTKDGFYLGAEVLDCWIKDQSPEEALGYVPTFLMDIPVNIGIYEVGEGKGAKIKKRITGFVPLEVYAAYRKAIEASKKVAEEPKKEAKGK